jgi:crotonobetainyl-CoA:carnitine CoA-transferase CaiB-like acyl-CoA transferase
MPLPLEGIRICDLTIVFAGPICTSILADLGAEVIKIENTNARGASAGGTDTATAETQDRPYNRVPNFHELNRGKKGITLNLMHPEAKEAFLRLVRKSDVVIENFSSRVMHNFGLDYDVLREEKSDLIMVSMPAFGSTGPMANRISFGPGIDALSGMNHLTGFPDGVPTKPGHVLGDFNAGLSAAYTVMMALMAKRRTGKGQRIEISMREGQTFLIGEYLVAESMNQRSPGRQGNRHSSMAPHGVYPCQGEDAWLALAIDSDEQWQRLRAVLGDPTWAQDERFASVLGRHTHQDEIDAPLGDWTREQDPFELTRLLQAQGIAAGAVQNGRTIAEDKHFQSRDFIRPVPTPEADVLQLLRPGFTLSRNPVKLLAAPSFGADNHEVLSGLLGFSDDEILQMEEVGAISNEPVQAAHR